MDRAPAPSVGPSETRRRATPWRIAVLTSLTLAAFASNSILCRLALGSDAIDPASFTTLRLAAGAAVLAGIVRAQRARPRGSWGSALALFLYAAPFSFAYRSLNASTGALVLFGCVQATMVAAGLREGERPHRLEWAGLAIALAGLVYLVSPGLTAPDPLGCLLMGAAGVAWGIYSMHGRGSAQPVAATAGNFLRSAPFSVVATALFWRDAHASPGGIVLALVSGAVTSGLGYVLWYAALRGLSATRAATVQLAVPVLAGFGGALLLDEAVTLRLLLAALLILGGVAMTVRGVPGFERKGRAGPGRPGGSEGPLVAYPDLLGRRRDGPATGTGVRVRARSDSDAEWIAKALRSTWGGAFVVSRGRGHRADQLPALVAERSGRRVGLLTYRIEGTEMEVVTLQATKRRIGAGSALLRAARDLAERSRCRRLWLVTTNDNAPAIAFYRAMGMRQAAVHRGAAAQARLLKPEIPLVGTGGVPIEDEIEFDFDLGSGSGS